MEMTLREKKKMGGVAIDFSVSQAYLQGPFTVTNSLLILSQLDECLGRWIKTLNRWW